MLTCDWCLEVLETHTTSDSTSVALPIPTQAKVILIQLKPQVQYSALIRGSKGMITVALQMAQGVRSESQKGELCVPQPHNFPSKHNVARESLGIVESLSGV